MVDGFWLVLIRCLSLLCVLTCWCSIASAQSQSPAPVPSSGAATRLSSRGRIMVAGQVSGFWSNDEPALFGSNRTWTVRADPALTYFVWDDLGFSVVVSGGYSRGKEFGGGGFEERALGAAAECAWNIALGNDFSLMPRGSLGYLHARSARSSRHLDFRSTLTKPLPRNAFQSQRSAVFRSA